LAEGPRVLFLMARDKQAPRSFLQIGDRLTFRDGIVVLSVLAAVVYVAFSGNTNALLPLYAVGVFLAFTLSQTGMVLHWRHHRDQPHWRKSMAFNATGAGTGAATWPVARLAGYESQETYGSAPSPAGAPALPGCPGRSWLGLPFTHVEVMVEGDGRADQRQVGECLGEVLWRIRKTSPTCR
jgi:Amino acid permease